jgi:two-component system CheB/CheR fusion protein
LTIARARWQGVVEGMAEEVWMCDAQGKISLLNVGTVTAMRLEQFKGKTVDQVLKELEILNPDGQPRPAEQAPLLRSLRGEVVRGEEIMRHRRTGITRWRHFSSAPLRDAAGHITGAVAVVRDVTENKQTEMDLKVARTVAERANQAAQAANQAKDDFLAVLSHELRNPLTPVLATAAMLHEDPHLDAEVRQQLEVIRRNAELEARLIDDLLDVTRITRGKVELDRQPIALCMVLERAVEVCRPDIEARGLHFGIDLPDPPYIINADAGRLQQVFWNLIKNAIKFTPHAGCVGLRCRRMNGDVLIEVNDSGIGIEPDMLPRIFHAFEQGGRGTTRQFGGLGLGLTISKAMVELHGGTIEARSAGKGKGATFTVRLPLQAAAKAPAGWEAAALCLAQGVGRDASAGAAQPAGRNLRILLVEDHGDTARIMKTVLTRQGHEVHLAGDVATALSAAQQRGRASGEGFDLLISDLGLPDGSGHDLMRALRAAGLTFPGIALSGYGQEQDVQDSHAAGFAEHLTKPASLTQLQAAVGRALAASTAEQRRV